MSTPRTLEELLKSLVRRVTLIERRLAVGRAASVSFNEVPIGGAVPYFGTAATLPSGWLIADGSAFSAATYPVLASVLGGTNLPDMRQRVAAGRLAGDADFGTLGATGGAKTVTLTPAQMPSHTHVQDAHTHTQAAHTHGYGANADGFAVHATGGSGYIVLATGSTGEGVFYRSPDSATPAINSTTATNQSAGGGDAHPNLQPFIVTNYIIRAA